MNIRKGHEVVINAPVKCAFCDMDGVDREATYDGRTVYRSWAFMCDTHWVACGPGDTGVGNGQKLIVQPVR